MKELITILLLCYCISSHSQVKTDTVGLNIYLTDTIFLELKTEKVISYKLSAVTILLDHNIVKEELTIRTQGKHWPENAQRLLGRLIKSLEIADTVYWDEKTFFGLNWPSLDMLICLQIEKGRCLIKDNNNRIYTYICRDYGIYKNDRNYYEWGGNLYRLPDQKEHFKECTTWEN